MCDVQGMVSCGITRNTSLGGRRAVTLLIACGGLASSSFAQSSPASSELVIRGVVRDFQASHPDFAITDPAAMGHTARSVLQSLGSDGLPRFAGAGLEITNQWFDKDANPIMPYGDPGLFGGHFDVDVYDMLTTSELYHEHQFDDKFDVTSIDIAGDSKLLFDSVLGATYPNPVRIEFMNPHNGGGGTFVFEDSTGVTYGLTADGFTRTVLPSDIVQLGVNFETLSGMRQTDPGTSQGDQVDRDDSFSVRMFDTVSGELVYECTAYEHYKAPKKGGKKGGKKGDKKDDKKDDDDDKDDEGGGGSGPAGSGPSSVPPKVGSDSCGVSFSDTTGNFGANDSGGITSETSLGQWFRSAPGVNLPQPHSIVLDRDANGVYEYSTYSFFPVEDLGYGNQGEVHNSNFTYSFTASFNYRACQGQFIEFEGNDDAWIFINGQLVMDLGGVATPSRQYVSMDRLGLADGESFMVSFFYANRRDEPDSLFRLRIKAEVAARVYEVAGNPYYD